MVARIARAVVALLAAAAIGLGAWQLEAPREGLEVRSVVLADAVPATVLLPRAAPPGPAVVVAHGFAGSQQLMHPFAVTLARNGYRVVTFDFPGHGRNRTPMPGPEVADAGRAAVLLAALEAAIGQARALPGADGRLALLGHSMGADIVARRAAARDDIAATVGVSLVSRDVTAERPRRLLMILGALEPPMLQNAAAAMLAQSPTDRRVVAAPGVEHIGVLYSATALAEAVSWLDASFGRQGSGFVEHRAPWLGVLFLGLVALAWPASRLLPAGPVPEGRAWPWLVLLLPPLAAPLMLARLPTGGLPILLADYIAVHFALCGGLTLVGLRLLRVPFPRPGPGRAAATLAVAAWSLIVIGVAVDRYLANFLPTPERGVAGLVVLAGTLPWFLADEWLTRSCRFPGLAYAATKLLYVASLAIAIALDPNRLFFLIIILPVMLIFLLMFGLLSQWSFRRTGDPLPGALANAALFAWAIAATFPMVG